MPQIKGPAIESEVFRVEGHCCGIRIPALQDPDSDGLRFEFSPENRAAALGAEERGPCTALAQQLLRLIE